MKRLFFGGIHPKYNKEMSTQDMRLLTIVPAQVVIPLQQHIGAPCKSLVSVGDHVLMGQKIGDGEGLCVPVHASVSGIVTAIEPRPHTSGRMVESIVIENDLKDTPIDLDPNTAPVSELDSDEILHRTDDSAKERTEYDAGEYYRYILKAESHKIGYVEGEKFSENYADRR